MFVVVDLLRRALKYEGGYGVRGVMNYTDVDDRTILESQKAGQPLREYTTHFVTAFEKDAAALGLEPVEENPRATDPENIEAMGETIKALERNGHTYRSDGSIYFRIATLPGLRQARASRSRRDEERRPRRLRQVRQGRRARLRPVEGDEAGRADVGPGHRSRTAGMAHRVFRDGAAAARPAPIDIHAGGVDLIFPHHENEIAQSEGATGTQFSRFWFHVEHLMIDDEEKGEEKMSKSLGNVFNLEDIVGRGFRPSALRYLYLGVHYRKQLRFSWTAMAQAEEALKRITDFLARLDSVEAGCRWPGERPASAGPSSRPPSPRNSTRLARVLRRTSPTTSIPRPRSA